MCSTRSCMRLADTIEKQVELRRKVKSAMTYPIVVLAICSVIADGDAPVHRPAVQGDLRRPRRHAAAADAAPISVSDLLKKFFPIFILLGVVGVFLFRQWIKSEQGEPKWDAFKLRVPVVRRADPQGGAGPLLAARSPR